MIDASAIQNQATGRNTQNALVCTDDDCWVGQCANIPVSCVEDGQSCTEPSGCDCDWDGPRCTDQNWNPRLRGDVNGDGNIDIDDPDVCCQRLDDEELPCCSRYAIDFQVDQDVDEWDCGAILQFLFGVANEGCS